MTSKSNSNPSQNQNDSQSSVESAIVMTDVKKTFDGKDFVLKGMTFSVPKGSLTAIIGYSGTGKSVVLKHILGIFKPTSGKIEVLGEDISTFSNNQLTQFRCKFGVLFQSAALFDDMSILENVCFPLLEHRRDLKYSKVVEIAEMKLHQVGLESRHYRKLPSQVSGGMQKRTGLARALALDPDILVYDEPTTGLDPILTEMVDNLILETHKLRSGITSVMVSHDLHAAFRIADFIAMLDSGRVLLFGTKEDFFKTDIDLVKRFVSKGMEKKTLE